MTIDKEFLEVLNDDVRILTSRALDGKWVTAFGIDGNGEFGTDYHGHRYIIEGSSAMVDEHSDVNKPEGYLMVSLAGYDAKRQGHVLTDHPHFSNVWKCLKCGKFETRELSK